jgi:hypothetical protein
MAEDNNFDELFSRLHINDGTTRSSASRSKRANGVFFCAVCFRAFDERNDLKAHVRRVHKSDHEAVKTEYKDAKDDAAARPNSEAAKHNLRLALTRLTMLENFRGRNPQG